MKLTTILFALSIAVSFSTYSQANLNQADTILLEEVQTAEYLEQERAIQAENSLLEERLSEDLVRFEGEEFRYLKNKDIQLYISSDEMRELTPTEAKATYTVKREEQPVLDLKVDTRETTGLEEIQSLSVQTTSAATTINKSLPVGEIPISTDVSPSGATVHTVPIDIYPGINGHQPQLALVYNSQGGNQGVGTGWSLSGFSCISRTNKNTHYDGSVSSIAVDNNDAFTLDGMRLIKQSQNSSKIEYETEQGFIKVRAYLYNSYIRYFEVFYPDGSIATMGSEQNRTSTFLDYPVSKLKDKFGNEMLYGYDYYGNYYRLRSVRYGSATAAESCYVTFEYESQSTPIAKYYRAGFEVTNSYLLKNIICKYGTTKELRRYELAYEDKDKLKSITCKAGGKSLNPLTFEYGSGATEPKFPLTSNLWTGVTPPVPNTDSIRVKMIRGKVSYIENKDGIAMFESKSPYYYRIKGSTILWESNYSGSEVVKLLKVSNDGTPASSMSSPTTGAGFVDAFFADVDGINGDEFIRINNYVLDGRDVIKITVYSPSRSGDLSLKHTTVYDFAAALSYDGRKFVCPKEFHVGDFLGVGMMQLMVVSQQNPRGVTAASTTKLIHVNAKAVMYTGNQIPLMLYYDRVKKKNEEGEEKDYIDKNGYYHYYQNPLRCDRLFSVDFDGDGKTEICHISASGTKVYTFTYTGAGNATISQKSALSSLKRTDIDNRQVIPGDINGDGLTDLAVAPANQSNSNVWDFYFSNGKGTFIKSTTNFLYGSGKNDGYFFHDIDCDGFPELVQTGNDCFYVHRNTHGTFPLNSRWGFEITNGNGNAVFVPSDGVVNKYYSSSFYCITGNQVRRIPFEWNATKEKMMSSMTNSHGVVSQFKYQTLQEADNTVYHIPSGSVDQHVNSLFRGPLSVTTRHRTYLNGSLVNQAEMYYEDAIVNKKGLGFRGFRKTKQTNTTPGTTGRWVERTYDQGNFGVLVQEETPTSRTINQYDQISDTDPDKRVRIKLRKQTVTDTQKGNTVITTYDSYDSSNYPLTVTVDYGGNTKTVTKYKYEHWNNSSGTGRYVQGILRQQSVVNTRGNQSDSTRYNVYIHEDIPCGTPYFTLSFVNGNQVMKKVYSYDTRGLITSVSEMPYTSTSYRVTKYEYDSRGRLIKEVSPIPTIYKKYNYSDNDGSLTSTENQNRQQVQYTYDAFGRMTQTKYADGGHETVTFGWSGSGELGLYYKKIDVSSKPNVWIYYDALGRELRSSTRRPDGQLSNVDIKYDAYGRKTEVSLPFTTTARHWTKSTYDSDGRPETITEASGKKTTYSYEGNTVTTTKDGIKTIYTYDATGKLIKVVDPCGETILYTYTPSGQLLQTTAPGNVLTKYNYNSLGQKVTMQDPSFGVTAYEYDSRGRLWRETDANGKTVTLTYNGHGQLTQRVTPEFTTNYAYNNDGQLVSEISTNGTARYLTYDTLGRVTVDKEVVDGYWFETRNTYSSISGRLTTHLFASSFCSKPSNQINSETFVQSYGHTNKITDIANNVLWQQTKTNELNQPIEAKTGKVTRTYTYNEYGIPTGRQSKNDASQTIQDFAYTFEVATGNLTSRSDKTRTNKKENFQYDNMNRLKTGVEYNSKGSISYKTSVGTYHYNVSGKPYALSKLSPVTSAVPQRAQNITYTSFKRPATITENGRTAEFTYTASGARAKMVKKQNGSVVSTTYYFADRYEVEVKAGLSHPKERFYMAGTTYTAPVVSIRENGQTDYTTYYICRDYQGSITHIADKNGNKIHEYSYDPWGRLRDPASHTPYAPGAEPTLFLGRGYTGHEHLPEFGLINMNARLYDPVVGQFLSPDPYVQAPDNTQNYNRYAYCLNNPLKYTDPSGEFWHIIVGAVIGGVSNLVANWGKIDNFGQGLAYFGAGAGVGALSAAGGAWAASAFKVAGIITGGAVGALTGSALGGSSSLLLNGMNNVIGGNNFFDNWKSSLTSGMISGAVSGAIGGAKAGYKMAKAGGKNMWWGTENGYNRGKWSLDPWRDIPNVLEYDASEITTSNPHQYECDDYSFGSTHGDENYRPGSTVGIEEVGNGASTDMNELMEILQEKHNEGYQKMHVNVAEYGGKGGPGHRMPGVRVEHVPNKYLKVTVYDSAKFVLSENGKYTAKSMTYNLMSPNSLEFKFLNFHLYR